MCLSARALVEKTSGHHLRKAGLFFSAFVFSLGLKALPKLDKEETSLMRFQKGNNAGREIHKKAWKDAQRWTYLQQHFTLCEEP